LENGLRGKRKENSESESHSAKKLRGSKSQEHITVAVPNPTIAFEDEASTIEVTAPHHTTQAQPLFMVEPQDKIVSPSAADMQAVLAAFQEMKEQLQGLQALKEQLKGICQENQGFQEMKDQLQGLCQENQALRDEVTSLKETFGEALKAALEEFKASPPPTWAQVTSVGNGPTSPDASWPSLSDSQRPSNTPTWSPRPSQMDVQIASNREKVVILSLGKAASTLKGKPMMAIKELAQKKLQEEEITKEVKVLGVSAISGQRLEIQTESKKQADIARANAQWVVGFGEEAKVRQATWYPIKVDGVARENICKKTGNGWQFKDDTGKLLEESNSRPNLSVKVMKMYWLSKPTDKPTGSMAIYLDSWSVAQQLVAEGVFLIGANAAYPAPFIKREQPIRCYKCNKYGHMQSKCPAAQPQCGRCAGFHETMNCPGTSPAKCAACHGPHPVTDPRCPVYEKHRDRKEQSQGHVLTPLCL
jgi:regulator of replication initiation timing